MNPNANGVLGSNGNHRWWHIRKKGRSEDLSSHRRLALQLHAGLPREEEGSRSVLVVAPDEPRPCIPGSMTLASCLAEELHQPVLLVDATADSAVSHSLGSGAGPGLADFLTNPEADLSELVQPTSQVNLWFLPRGASDGRSASPDSARDFLATAALQWDFVVVAGGSVLRDSLPLAMAPHVGRVLLLVGENRTYVNDITAAQGALERCDARNVSLVMTRAVR